MDGQQGSEAALEQDPLDAMQRIGVCLAQEKMRISKVVAIANKMSFAYTDMQIQLEMETLHRILSEALSEKAAKPLKAAIESGRLDSSGDTALGRITRISDALERQFSTFQIKIDEANEDVATVGVLLDDELPTFEQLKKLTLSDRMALAKRWKDIEMFMRNYEQSFIAFQTEWDDMKRKLEEEVEAILKQVEIMLKEKDAVNDQEGRND